MKPTCDTLFVSDPDAPVQWKSVRHARDKLGDTVCGLATKQFVKDPDNPRTWWHVENTKDTSIPACRDCIGR